MDAVRVIVVVPAHNEESTIGGCLTALAAQTVGRSTFETIVVLDNCDDATERVIQASVAELGLAVRTLDGPGEGAGAARRVGMDAAATCLFALGQPNGLIACTDADSSPAPDWLERQLAHAGGGARVIAGLIELDPEESAALPRVVTERRDRDAAVRLQRLREHDPAAAHHHFAGASMAITAEAYRHVGGLEPLPSLEDAAFAARLQDHRVPILRATDVRVHTSARARGRVERGLSVDLEVSSWSARRRYSSTAFTPDVLAAAKGTETISVVIPTKQCADTIGDVIRHTVSPVAQAGLVDELLVIDAGSPDGTAEVAAEAGARVIDQDELLREYGPALGKGDAMWRALSATRGDLVCFLDGDTGDPDQAHLLGLLAPLLTEDRVHLVKGAFERPLQTSAGAMPHEGGRVTELMARPLLNLHVPRLAGFAQPLAGEFAARRDLLDAVRFPVGYGVEIAVLIDALDEVGLDALAECDLGTRQNRHQPLRALGEMAYAVLAAVERRVAGERTVIAGAYMRPWDDDTVAAVPVTERPALRTLRDRTRMPSVVSTGTGG